MTKAFDLVVRGGIVEPARAHSGVLRRRGHADARGDARGNAPSALLPGVIRSGLGNEPNGPIRSGWQ